MAVILTVSSVAVAATVAVAVVVAVALAISVAAVGVTTPGLGAVCMVMVAGFSMDV